MTDGIKTSEFKIIGGAILTVIVAVATALIDGGHLEDNQLWLALAGMVVSVGGSLGYGAIRALTKAVDVSARAKVAAAHGRPMASGGLALEDPIEPQ